MGEERLPQRVTFGEFLLGVKGLLGGAREGLDDAREGEHVGLRPFEVRRVAKGCT